MESLANTWCCASADSLNGHDPLPGKGHQALHADWRPAAAAMKWQDGEYRAEPEEEVEVPAAGAPQQEPPPPPPPPIPASGFGVVNSIWMLDDWTAATGASRMVPRSHSVPPPVPGVVPKMGPPPGSSDGDTLGGPAEAYAVRIEAPAGSVCVFNGSVWCERHMQPIRGRRGMICALCSDHESAA